MKFDIGEKVRQMFLNWLNINPASEQTFVLNERTGLMADILRAKLWYRGDAYELSQFFKQLGCGTNSFWGSVPDHEKVRKIHSGLPAIIADTLAYIVYSDMDDIAVEGEKGRAAFEEISQNTDFTALVGKAIVDTLVEGDGAFKISVDEALSSTPIVEFVGADKTEYRYLRGVLSEVIFRSAHENGNRIYQLEEHYGRGYIESRLYDHSGHEVNLDSIPCLAGIEPRVEFAGDYIMAVPLRFYASKKYSDRRVYLTAVNQIVSMLWTRLSRSGGTRSEWGV